jgi:hypothetical protein
MRWDLIRIADRIKMECKRVCSGDWEPSDLRIEQPFVGNREALPCDLLRSSIAKCQCAACSGDGD